MGGSELAARAHRRQYRTGDLMAGGLVRHHWHVALRTKIAAWLAPEATWARARRLPMRHPWVHLFLLVFWSGETCFCVWQAVVASSLLGVIGNLGCAAVSAIVVWYLWLVRRDAHLGEPPSWWPGVVRPRS